MLTPAWSIMLHQQISADKRPVQFVIEKMVPPGISNSVISWIYFETSVVTTESVQPDVLVTCAGEVIWTGWPGQGFSIPTPWLSRLSSMKRSVASMPTFAISTP